jgi:four helix bundle protein
MIRSSESIGSNIAEGRGSAFEREYIRFLDIAARSAHELSSQLTMAVEYGIVPKQQAFNLNGTVICTRRMVESLRDAVQRNYHARRARERAQRTSPNPGNGLGRRSPFHRRPFAPSIRCPSASIAVPSRVPSRRGWGGARDVRSVKVTANELLVAMRARRRRCVKVLTLVIVTDCDADAAREAR